MKIRFTQRFLNLTGEAQREYEVFANCGCGKCETDDYFCTTEPATYSCQPPGYGNKLHHVHTSNVEIVPEPCDPEPAPGPEPKDQAKLSVVEPAAKAARPALSETKETT